MSTTNNNTNVNSQIVDAIRSMNILLKEAGNESLETIGNQVLIQAASLAMLNMVNQQQQLYILQNTVTTVAVKAMLESNPEEALKIMNATVNNSTIMNSFKEFEQLIKEISKSKEKQKK